MALIANDFVNDDFVYNSSTINMHIINDTEKCTHCVFWFNYLLVGLNYIFEFVFWFQKYFAFHCIIHWTDEKSTCLEWPTHSKCFYVSISISISISIAAVFAHFPLIYYCDPVHSELSSRRHTTTKTNIIIN